MMCLRRPHLRRGKAIHGRRRQYWRDDTFYEAEARYAASREEGNRTSLLATLHKDIVLHQPETLPYGGTYRGRAEFGAWLKKFTDTWVNVTPSDPSFYNVGDVLISTVTMNATARHTLRPIAMPMCQIVRFAEGLPIEWRNFAWDTAVMRTALGLDHPNG